MLVHLSALLIGILVVPGLVLSGQFSDLDKGTMAELKNEIKIQKKAHKIHSKILTIDTHQDTPLIMSIYPSFFGEEFDLSQRYEIAEFLGFTFRQVDFPRMKEGWTLPFLWLLFLRETGMMRETKPLKKRH